MPDGITQPGGAGTTIYIRNDADTGGGRPVGPYTFAQISAAFPADFIDLGTNQKTYRSLVDLQIGDPNAGDPTTTLKDTNVKVDWDAGFTLRWKTNNAAYSAIFGTKCGTGTLALGANGCDLTFGGDTTLRIIYAYGSKFRKKGIGRISILPGVTGTPTGELLDCDIQGDVTYNGTIIGTTIQRFLTVYNCTFSAAASASQSVFANIFATNVERLALSASGNAAFISTNAVDLTFKDLLMKGAVSFSDIRLNNGAARWELVRPVWSQTGVPKFSFSTAFSITLANALRERWLYNVKLVDVLGDAVAGIPVSLTDLFGNVVVNAVTDANGRVSFGSGITTNAVQVMDHYGTAGVYIQRHRGPFLEQINVGAGSNPNYFPQTRLFKWPGHETVTLTAGTFEDVNSIIQMDSILNPTAREEWRPAYA